MPKVKQPEYPEELTVKYWNKKKGLIARVSKIKTGITEELIKTQKLFDDVPWKKLDLTVYLPTTYDQKGLDEAMRKFSEETSDPVIKSYKGMRSLETFLESKAKELAKDSKTKGFAGDVEKMSEVAKKFSFAIAPGTLSDPIAEEYKLSVKAIEAREKVLASFSKVFKTYVTKALKATLEAQTNGMTKSEYITHWSENLRGIGTAAAQVAQQYPELKTPMGRAKTEWAQGAMPKTDEEVPEKLKSDAEILKAYGKVAVKLAV